MPKKLHNLLFSGFVKILKKPIAFCLWSFGEQTYVTVGLKSCMTWIFSWDVFVLYKGDFSTYVNNLDLHFSGICVVRLRFASESLLATPVECTDKVKVIFRPQVLIKMKSDIRRLKQEIFNKLKENLEAVATNAISTIVSGGKF